MSKYHNRITYIDGIRFHSAAEAYRYCELKLARDNGVISDLTLQPRFVLLEGFKDSDGNRVKPIYYKGDFKYIQDGKVVVEDVKGALTEVYRLKRKLFKHRYPEVDFREVAA